MSSKNGRPIDLNRTSGIECPDCGCRHFFTIKTAPELTRIKRWKNCRNCGKQIISYEARFVPHEERETEAKEDPPSPDDLGKLFGRS